MAAFDYDLASLIALAQRGDDAALEALCERYRDAVFRYFYARSADAVLAEQLTGVLWDRVGELLPTFRWDDAAGEVAFAAWLYAIARAIIRDDHHQTILHHLPLIVSRWLHRGTTHPQVVARADPDLYAVLAKLEASSCEVILLRLIEQRSCAEIARLMDISEETAHALQYEALQALARGLAAGTGEHA
jgi:RNA polymerase sigma-70 factor, ECF subfamily